jgi:hypothetical protein
MSPELRNALCLPTPIKSVWSSIQALAASEYHEDQRAQAGTLAKRPSGITGSGGSMSLIAVHPVSDTILVPARLELTLYYSGHRRFLGLAVLLAHFRPRDLSFLLSDY